MNSKERKNIIIGILMVLVVAITIGYSVLSSRLTVNGTSSITSDFSIAFTNITEGQMNNATTVNKVINVGTSAIFQVDLKKPGSNAEYIVTVENQGKIDATLESIEGITEANEKAPTYITFSLENINVGDVLNVGESTTFKVKVMYDSSATEIPDESKQLTLKLNYVQKTGTSTPPVETLGSISEYLINNKVNNSILDGENGLVALDNNGMITSTTPREYRYIGANPDNYVMFNDELWRIIGIFDNKVKLYRKDQIENVAFDTNSGIDWSKSSLKELLNNGDYYNRTGIYSEIGLKEESKNMIQDTTWYLGGVNKNDQITTQEFYDFERGSQVVEGNATTWSGKVGIIYPSDFGFSTSGNSTTNRNACLNADLSLYYDYSDCYNNSWLKESIENWTITPWIYEGYNAIYTLGMVLNPFMHGTSNVLMVHPTVYLKDTVELISGTGTESDPYILNYQ